LAAAIAALPFPILLSANAAAEPATAPVTAAAPHALGTVIVTANRVEQEADEVAATVTAITDEQIAREMPVDVQDLLRHEAGVSVRAQPNRSSGVFRATGRAGNEGINIRGLEGDQVRLQVDGVRLPSTYASGPYAAGRADYIDVEAFKRVEILRGASSTQYGSDGLAGAVSFLTKDPADLLTLGKDTQFALKTGYHAIDNSWSLVPSFATRGEMVEAMVLATSRRGHESKTGGDNDVENINRTTANPADVKSDYLLGKLLFKFNRNHKLKLTAENLERDNRTRVLTFFGDPFAAAGLNDVKVREDISRQMVKLDYSYLDTANRLFQRADFSLYNQQSKNRQLGFEGRTAASGWNTRTRDTEYSEDVTGGSVQFESNFGRDISHRLIYGFDTSMTNVDSMKEGANLRNGVPLTGAAGFAPNKSFPDTDYRLSGAFIQDEIGIGNLVLVPGLRYDEFKLTPHPDALYAVTNAAAPSTLSDNAVSPKLGAIWKLSPMVNLFAQYAHGFRAPAPSQVNGGVTNLTASQPYTSIGNPALKPETSDSFELGWRGRTDTVRYSASVFQGKYKDFIASNVRVGGSGTTADPIVYQSVNLSDVKIRGFELRGEWNFMRNWTLLGSYAHARGDQTTEGTRTPLETIDPDKLLLALRFDSERFGGQATVTAVERKSRNPHPATTFTPGGYSLLDLTAWYNISRNATINIGIFNLLDKKYFLWSDVRGLDALTPGLDAYSQAGRNASVSFRYQF
jgi:hemoglobin/transferrin/lactoferrin receptor protein